MREPQYINIYCTKYFSGHPYIIDIIHFIKYFIKIKIKSSMAICFYSKSQMNSQKATLSNSGLAISLCVCCIASRDCWQGLGCTTHTFQLALVIATAAAAASTVSSNLDSSVRASPKFQSC